MTDAPSSTTNTRKATFNILLILSIKKTAQSILSPIESLMSPLLEDLHFLRRLNVASFPGRGYSLLEYLVRTLEIPQLHQRLAIKLPGG